MNASESPPPSSTLVLYQTEDGQTHVQCRFEEESIWLTQALIGELFQRDVRTINEHLQNIFAEGELPQEATTRKFRIVRLEGARQVAREVEHYKCEDSRLTRVVYWTCFLPLGSSQWRPWASVHGHSS